MKSKLNVFSALIFQLVTILSGLILPRLIIESFGSDINGLISSIKQFLSFISLFEGGLGAVVLSELYKPIEENNKMLISQILDSCSKFFRKLSIGFLIYTIVLSLIYPFLVKSDKSFGFVSSLIFILSINTLMQYMFSITFKLFLQANQKVYITNFISSIVVLLNIIFTLFVIKHFDNVQLIYIGSSIVFLIQPIFFNAYINRNYNLIKQPEENKKILNNKKSGFLQNFAHFINMNTDIIIITLFASLNDVSIYSIYMLAFLAIRNIISTAANSYQSALGKYYASNNIYCLRKNFFKYEKILWLVSTICFSTCLLLINPFVQLYTKGISDSNYYQPIFAIIMTLAQFFYTARESYRYLILATGKFIETNFGSFMEAMLNVTISIILVSYFGLVGVALGTLIAILYRLFYFIVFLKNNIIYLTYNRFISLLLTACTVFIINICFMINFNIVINDYLTFIIYGFIIIFCEIIITFSVFLIINKTSNKFG